MIFVGDKEQIAPGSLRVGCNFGNPLEHGALEIELQHHPEAARKRWIHRNGEIEAEDVSTLEEILERRERLPAGDLGRIRVHRALGTEGAVDRRIFIEERQEHDDTLDDGGLDLRVETPP